MFRFFVDDSGKEPHDSPCYILAGWMARVDDWERFSDSWEISLAANNPKPLGYHKGARYFSNRQAMGQNGCFEGFTVEEAAHKTANLGSLVVGLSPRICGFLVTVPHDEHKTLVVDKAVTRRGKIRPEQRLPFYLAFSHLVPTVHALHYHAGFRDKIDFIFDGDKTDSPLRHCIDVYNSIKESFKGEIWYPMMGEIIPGDDRELAPLQAADMFAGQMRQSIILGDVLGSIKQWQDNRVKIVGEYIGGSKLEKWSQGQNEEAATKILTMIKEQRENPVSLPPSKKKKR